MESNPMTFPNGTSITYDPEENTYYCEDADGCEEVFDNLEEAIEWCREPEEESYVPDNWATMTLDQRICWMKGVETIEDLWK